MLPLLMSTYALRAHWARADQVFGHEHVDELLRVLRADRAFVHEALRAGQSEEVARRALSSHVRLGADPLWQLLQYHAGPILRATRTPNAVFRELATRWRVALAMESCGGR